MKQGNFLFQESFYMMCSKLTDPSVRLAVYDIMIEYGTTGENKIDTYPFSSNLQRSHAELVLSHILPEIEKTNQWYAKCVERGRRGGLKGGKLGGRGHKKAENGAPAGQTENKS